MPARQGTDGFNAVQASRKISDISPPVPVRSVDLDLDSSIIPDTPSFTVFWQDEAPVGVIKAFDAVSERLGRCERRHPDARRNRATDRDTSVSVVICTRDRPDELARCLASFSNQSVKPTEIIVVDNGSVDARTKTLASDYSVRYVREDRPGLDRARNAGVQAANCEIVAFADDDTVLHSRWLQRVLAAFDSSEIWSVTGQVLPAELETPAQCVFEKVWSLGKGFETCDYGPEFYARTRRRGCPAWEIGAGANMAFRRDVFDRIGGFDERLDAGAAGCSGDSEFWNRILHAGGTCRYDPTAVVYHYHRRELVELERQIRAYMRGHVAALLVQYERTRELGNLRRLIRTLPRWYLYKTWWRLTGRYDSSTCLLGAEIRGAFEGLSYYLTHRSDASSKPVVSIRR